MLGEVTGNAMTTCSTCNNSGLGDPRDWHHYRHSYKGVWKASSSSESGQGPVAGIPLRVPFDPVLRLALIRKGVITPEDLKAAEAEIAVTSDAFNSTIRDGGEPNDVSGRTPFDSA
jgi:hypothetical protein